MHGEDRDEPQQPQPKSLDMLAREALAIHDGDLAGATKMMAYIITRRTYLLDALVMDYLRRIQADAGS